MGLVTLMSLSNVVHLKEGPPDAMKFGNWKDNAYRRKVVKSVLAAGDALNEEKLWPLYLSFPSGDLELVKGRRTDQPELNRYTRYILTRYLRSFEERRGIVSFKNVKAKVPFKSDSELFNARFFLDVPSGEIYDLEHLRNKKGATAMVPEEIMRSAPRTMSQRIPKRHIDNIIFFIKGRTTFLLYVDKQKILAGQQFYGQSYQKFEISLKDMSFQPRPIISLKLKPVSEDHPAYLIGPFVFNKD